MLVYLVIKKVISILDNNPRAVKCIDLSGFPILKETLEELLKNKFSTNERLTILHDIWIIGYQMDYFNWVNISSGSENITLKVQNLFVCTIKEPARIELITRAKRNNQRIWGLKLSNLNFSDWDEVKRTLDMVETFTHLSMLDLSQN